MKTIVITRPYFFEGEEKYIAHLFEQGITSLHLRKPHAAEKDVQALIEKIPHQFRSQVVLHEHPHLVARYQLQGFHLNSRCPHLPDGFKGSVSRSCHSLEEVMRYKDQCDYVFLSPIFDSISKEGYGSAFSEATLQKAYKQGVIDSKVIALGGIKPEHAPYLKANGFGGMALLGYVWDKLQTPPVVLSIAGSDSSAGAGIQADIKTISALGGFATTAITAITAQNPATVQGIEPVCPTMVRAQIEAVMAGMPVACVKIGMVYSAAIIEQVAKSLQKHKPNFVVCDPVMISTSGSSLLNPDAIKALETTLFPLCHVITPNLYEAEHLYGSKILTLEDTKLAAKTLSDKYHVAVLIKGGHQTGNILQDILYANEQYHIYPSAKVATTNLHGTGCTLSSAIATYMAHGATLPEAVKKAKAYITHAIVASKDIKLSTGYGPLNHFYSLPLH
jgi:hydroxymethylpyrimidine kinase/phosphomethylpyrimidine kinase